MPKKSSQNNNTIWTSGRRKTAIARVKLEKGEGEFRINDKSTPEEYLPTKLDLKHFYEPFFTVGRNPQGFNVSIKFHGGGKKAQVDAARLALAKALVELDGNLRKIFKDKNFLTRDPRMKERKKYGLRKARKAPQYSKR